MKPKIFFIPRYIAQLKHFERLIPRLRDAYDIGFLFIGGDGIRLREVVDYCKEKNHELFVINDGFIKNQKIRIPFVTPLWERYAHGVACRKFLTRAKPAKIIATKAAPPQDTIIKEANRSGVQTIILQWSGSAPRRAFLVNKRKPETWFRRLYHATLSIISRVLDFFDFFRAEARFGLTPAVPQKIGVFDEEEAAEGLGKGYDRRSITVVGSIDFQLTHEIKETIESNPAMKKALLEKYRLHDKKTKILVILFRFYRTPPEEEKMTVPEHVAHYYDIFKTMREVFPSEEADIFLKLHPSESSEVKANIYSSYEKDFEVKLFRGEAKTDELVCLADLYIGEPQTSVNYMLLGSGIPALFLNLSPRKSLNKLAQYFGIKHIVETKEDFKNTLFSFKNGTLPKQYDNSDVDMRSVDNVVALIN